MRIRKQLFWPPWWTGWGDGALIKHASGSRYRVARVNNIFGMSFFSRKPGKKRYLYLACRKNDGGKYDLVSIHNTMHSARVAMEYLAGEDAGE